VRQGTRSQLADVEVGIAELQQGDARTVLVRPARLLDEPVRHQRLQEAVDGGAGEAETIGDLADAEAARPIGQKLEDARRAIYRLDRRATI
jgi:hypothetical protein